MPRFDPQYIVEHGDAARAHEMRPGLVRGHYLGALGAGASTMTVSEQRGALRRNRAAAQREIDKRVPGKVTVNADGSLHLVNPLTGLNQAMSSLLRPAHPGIDATPLPAALKTKLKNQPVTFFLDLFDPVLNAIRDALVDVMERGLNRNTAAFKARTVKDTGAHDVGGFVYDLSTPPFVFTLGKPEFRSVNIWLYQPGDDLFDAESKGIILRMRMLLAYFVLFFRKPVLLQTTLVRAGLDFLFGKDDTAAVRVGQGGDGSSFDKPRIVSSMPLCWRRKGNDREHTRGAPLGPFVIRRYTSGGTPTAAEKRDVTKLVWEIPQYNPKGQKRSFIQLTQQAWDAYQRDVGSLGALEALGAGPPGAAETVVAKGAADTGTAAGGGEAGAAVIGAWCGGIASIITAVGGAIEAVVRAANKPAVAAEEAKEAAARAAQEEAKAAAQSASGGGISPALIVGAGLAAFLILKGRKP